MEEETPLPCQHGHPPSLQLTTNQGTSSFCLSCFSNLLLQPSAFLSHKAFALSQLSHALRYDPSFSAALLHHHRHLLVPPLCHAVHAFEDDSLSQSVVDIILTSCSLAKDHDSGLLDDFLLHFVLQLSSRIVAWSRGQCYMLHVLGQLLDDHSKRDAHLPEAIKSQTGFVINLVSGVKSTGDQVRGEILFVLYKLASLEDGIHALENFLAELIVAATTALLKTESDEIRTNSVAFLMTLAQKSAFDIRFDTHEDETEGKIKIGSSLSFNFLRTFAEAIKGCLLSSDTQVQITTLQLLCHMCPIQANIAIQLQVLIEEGIMDYIFEALRTSKMVEKLVAWCIRSLSLLSAGGITFKRRFPIGFETIIRILESSPSTVLSTVERDVLLLVAEGLPDCPGSISVARAEHLLLLLIERLKEHAGDGFVLIPDTFNSICAALTALLKLPCTLSIQNAVSLIQTAIKSAIIAISADIQHSCEVGMFKYTIGLLRESFSFGLTLSDQAVACKLTRLLIEACTEYVVPFFVECFQSLEDEHMVFTLFETLHFMLENDTSDVTLKLAEKLAGSSWLSVSFECIAQFPGQQMKDTAFTLIRALAVQLDGHSIDESIRKSLLQLPGDPQDLFFLLEQNSSHDSNLVLAQFATITILFISHLCCDRLADDGQILASLEQYLLINGPEFHMHFESVSIIRLLLCVYVWTRGALQNYGVPYSIEAERQLLLLVEHFRYEVVSARTPKNVLLWLFHKESIITYMVAAILNWFKILELYKKEFKSCELQSSMPERLENKGSFLKDLGILIDLVESDDCCASIFGCLLERVLNNQVEDDIHAVADILTDIARISVLAANQLCKCNILCDIKNWFVLYGCKYSGATTCLIELLFQLLSSLCPNQITDENIWLFIANQSVYLLLMELPGTGNPMPKRETLLLLNLLSLILHKATMALPFLRKAAEEILFNTQLHEITLANISIAGEQGAKLFHLDLRSSNGRGTCFSLVFYLSWLRCAGSILRADDLFRPNSGEEETRSISLSESLNVLFNKSCMQAEHLGRILYYGPPLAKVLASSCLVEIFYLLTERGQKNCVQEDGIPHFLSASLVMVIQGCLLDSNVCLQRNATFCLYMLITNTRLSGCEQKAVKGSCWYRFILEELLLALSTQGQTAGISVSNSYLPYIAVAFLALSPPLDWLKAIFRPAAITAIVSSLSYAAVSLGSTFLYKGLLRAGYLESDHIQKLQAVFQSARKAIYKCSSSSEALTADRVLEKDRHLLCSSTDCSRHSDAMCLGSHESIIRLVVSWCLNPCTGLRHFTVKEAEHCISPTFVAAIDEFLQESSLHV